MSYIGILKHTLRRLAYLIPVLLGVGLVIFILFSIVAPDPSLILLGKHATVQQIAELREELGLNRPWWLQYFDIVRSAFTFDFGRSWYSKQLITEVIQQGAYPSLTLTFPAFLVSTVLSLIISLLVAYYRNTGFDYFIRFLCIALVSVSSLVYILFFQYLLAYEWGWFPIAGFDPGLPQVFSFIILPGIIWVVLSLGPDVRFFRTVILDEIYQDYVRTARAKGLSEWRVLSVHVLKNSMIPILTYVVIQIPFLILGALLLENFFGIPGLGTTVLTAVNNSDFPVLKAFSILSAIAYIVFNLITDLLYLVVDPRVRIDS